MKSYLAAQELVTFALMTTILGFFVNIPLNQILIFGKLRAPGTWRRGFSCSISASKQFYGDLLVYLCRLQATRAGVVPADLATRLDIYRTVICLGLPISVTSLAEAGLFSASTLMMGWLGTIAVAAHGIALNITSLIFVIHVGLSSAATIQVGQAFGAHRLEELKRSAIMASLASGIVVGVTVVLFLSIPEFLVSLFVEPKAPELDQILTYGTLFLLMSALFSAVDAAQVMALGILRGIQDTSVPMGMAVVSYWLIGIPVAYLLAFPLGWEGVGLWAGLAIGLACAAIGLLARFVMSTPSLVKALDRFALRESCAKARNSLASIGQLVVDVA